MSDWYSDVGLKIVKTMIINSIMPYCFLGKEIVLPFLKKAWDRKFKLNDTYVTKNVSMQ